MFSVYDQLFACFQKDKSRNVTTMRKKGINCFSSVKKAFSPHSRDKKKQVSVYLICIFCFVYIFDVAAVVFLELIYNIFLHGFRNRKNGLESKNL